MDAPSKSRHITQRVISFFIGRYNGLEAGGFTSAALMPAWSLVCRIRRERDYPHGHRHNRRMPLRP